MPDDFSFLCKEIGSILGSMIINPDSFSGMMKIYL